MSTYTASSPDSTYPTSNTELNNFTSYKFLTNNFKE